MTAATAVALYLQFVPSLEPYTEGFHVPWWALAAGFAATEVFVIHAHVRGSAHTLSLSEIPLVIGLLLGLPTELIFAQVLGPLLVLLWVRGTEPIKVAFNIAQFTLTATITVLVLHAMVPAPAEIGPGVWTATFVAVGVGLARRRGARRSAVISLAEDALPSMETLQMFGADLVVSLTNTSIGLAGATLIAQDWHAGWLILPPAAVLMLAYRAYLSEHTKHRSLEFLYGVARSLTRAPDIETALVDLLGRTREAFNVGSADIILFGASQRPAAADVAARRGRVQDDAAGRARAGRGAADGACATSTRRIVRRCGRRRRRSRRSWTRRARSSSRRAGAR